MGLFSRLGTLIRSNINELINKAEDPEKMLNQVLVDMKSQLVEAKKQVAVAIADEKRLKKQYETEAAKYESDYVSQRAPALRAQAEETLDALNVTSGTLLQLGLDHKAFELFLRIVVPFD